MRNKYTVRLIVLASAFAIVFNTYHCKSLTNALKKYAPDIRLVDVNLGAIDFTGVNVDFKYEMKNKVNLGLTFTRLQFNLLVDGKRFFNADNKKNVVLKPKGISHFTITHRIVYTEFAESLITLFKKDQFKVTLNGKVGILVPTIGQSLEVPINGEKVVPVPKLPSVKFKKLQYVSASLNPFNPKAKFALKFGIKNNNKFGIDLSSIKYNFTAANVKLIDDTTGPVKLSSGKEKQLSLPITLRGKQIIKLVPKLRDLSNQKYSFNGELNMKVLGKTVKIPYSLGK